MYIDREHHIRMIENFGFEAIRPADTTSDFVGEFHGFDPLLKREIGKYTFFDDATFTIEQESLETTVAYWCLKDDASLHFYESEEDRVNDEAVHLHWLYFSDQTRDLFFVNEEASVVFHLKRIVAK